MAKTVTKKPAVMDIMNILMASIVASKTNPRTSFQKENIKDLADSMTSVGLLQPITLRPLADKFEIVAGERRYRAAKLLKWETIPAMVRNITDDEMLEIQIIENLQREDVSPLDEAHAFKRLLQKESIDWLAGRIHKTKKYISDRLKLNDLVPDATELVQKGILPLGHAVVISKLSFADQKQCISKCIGTIYGDDVDTRYCEIPIEKLKDFIADDIMLDFSKVSFDTDDATLYEQAGACTNCPKRTCNNNLLFADITSDDKCTDAACFNEKINLHVARAKDIAKEQYGKVLSGEKSPYSSTLVKVQGVEVKYSETPVKNGTPVVLTKSDRWNKKELGKTVYIDARLLEKQKVAKEENKSSKGNSSQTYETYEQRKKRFLVTNAERIQLAAKLTSPNKSVLTEFFRDELHSVQDEVLVFFAGITGFIPDIKTAEAAHEKAAEYYQDEDTFQIYKGIMDKLISHYTPEELIMIITMLKKYDCTDEDPTDRECDYGFTWKELMVELVHEKPAVKSAKKK